MGLQTGQPVARLGEPIINPYNLRIVAFYVSGPLVQYDPAVLFTEDIREFGQLGAIVDSIDQIMSPEDMVRLNEIISYQFVLNKLPVYDDRGKRLGKVEDYIVDPINFEIRQLRVKPPFLMSFNAMSLTIARSQIIKVEPHRITVKAPTIPVRAPAKQLVDDGRQILDPAIDNPFRKKPAISPAVERNNH